MPVPHLVEVACQIEGEHHLLTGAQCVVVNHPHDGFDALVEWARRTVRLQFVVLDKINAGAAEVIDESCRLGRTQANAWLDDGPDQRPSLNAGKAARPSDAELRPRIGLRKFRWQADIEKTQSCNRLELEQIAGDRSQQVRQRRTERIEWPRQSDAGSPKPRFRAYFDLRRRQRRTRRCLIEYVEPRYPCRHASF